jgi:hypothetical protein
MFNWAIEQGYIEFSPAVGLKKPAPENARTRVLTDDDIRKFLEQLPHTRMEPATWRPLPCALCSVAEREKRAAWRLPSWTSPTFGHVSAVKSVTTEHYNHHDYAPEMRAALERWERQLRELMTGATYNVITMPRRA